MKCVCVGVEHWWHWQLFSPSDGRAVSLANSFFSHCCRSVIYGQSISRLSLSLCSAGFTFSSFVVSIWQFARQSQYDLPSLSPLFSSACLLIDGSLSCGEWRAQSISSQRHPRLPFALLFFARRRASIDASDWRLFSFSRCQFVDFSLAR